MKRVYKFIVLALGLACAAPVFAAPTFVAQRGGVIYGTTTATSTSFSPTANDGLLAFLFDFSNNGITLTASGTGTYSLVTPPGQGTYANGTSVALWTNPAASSSSQTFTSTTAMTGDHVGAVVLEYSGTNTAALGIIQTSGAIPTSSTTPGTGAGAVKGISQFIPTGATLVALCMDNSGTTEPTASNGTSRATGQFTSGSAGWVIEDFSGAGASVTPACTSTAGATDDFTVTQFIVYPPGIYTSQYLQGSEGSPSATVALPQSVTSGAGVLVSVVAGWTNGGGTPTVTVSDNVNSGNYTPIEFYYDPTTTYFGGVYDKIPNATGTPTITATTSVGTLFIGGSQIQGFVGTPTIDTSASTYSFSHSAVTTQSGTIASAHANEALFAAPWNESFINAAVPGWVSFDGGDSNYFTDNLPSAQSDNFAGMLSGSSETLTVFSGIYDGSSASPAPLISNGHPLISNGHPVISQ